MKKIPKVLDVDAATIRLLDSAGENLLLVIDLDHRITMVNHTFLKNYDLKEHNIVGRH